MRQWKSSLVTLLVALIGIETCQAFFVNPKDGVIFPTTIIADNQECRIGLKPSPLIGGPKWLPVHVKVSLSTSEGEHLFDLVPLNATDPDTLGRLLTLQDVSAETRYKVKTIHDNNQVKENVIIQRANAFVQSYDGSRLHLLNNNCWTFALQLYYHLLADAEQATK